MNVYVVIPEMFDGFDDDPFVMCFGALNVRLLNEEVLLDSPDIVDETEQVPEHLFEVDEEEDQSLQRSVTEQFMFPYMDDPLATSYLESKISAPLLAALCLGSSGLSPTYHGAMDQSPDGEVYWRARREDLTKKGLALVELLEDLYQRRAILLTVLDT